MDLVAVYYKDKIELLDKSDEFKNRKSLLEKEVAIEEKKQHQKKQALIEEIQKVEDNIKSREQKIEKAKEDPDAFERFKLTEVCQSIDGVHWKAKDNKRVNLLSNPS